MIPKTITIKDGPLPDAPGVYTYRNQAGERLYIGKATSLKKRVGSYFSRVLDPRIAEMVSRIVTIEYTTTPTVIEALILEAHQIRRFQPKYNVLARDDKSFLFLGITNEPFPRPLLKRAKDLSEEGIDPFAVRLTSTAKKRYLRLFGPFTSGTALKLALKLLRPMFPWSLCVPPSLSAKKPARACFEAQLKQCPGVCTGTISQKTYRLHIQRLIRFFEGKKIDVIADMTRQMKAASEAQAYEEALLWRQRLRALTHIQDIALIREEERALVPQTDTRQPALLGRIEAYDISHLGGSEAVASLVVAVEGKPERSLYRRFRIKQAIGGDDYGALAEVMERRIKRFERLPNSWPLPELMVIDGGEGQVATVLEVLHRHGVVIPVMGIAKGLDRKQDRFVVPHATPELKTTIARGRELFLVLRDEAHRFAGAYQRVRRSKRFLGTGTRSSAKSRRSRDTLQKI